MSELKVTIEVDALDPESIKEGITLLEKISSETESRKKRGTGERSASAKKSKEKNQEAKKEEVEQTEEDDTAKEITIDDLRLIIGSKMPKHKEAIFAKVAEFKATKLSEIDKADFPKMKEFLEGLQ